MCLSMVLFIDLSRGLSIDLSSIVSSDVSIDVFNELFIELCLGLFYKPTRYGSSVIYLVPNFGLFRNYIGTLPKDKCSLD